jgi:hypothetical protein
MEQHVLAQMELNKWREGTSVSPNASLALDDLAGVGILTIRMPRTDDVNRLEYDVLLSAYRAAATALRADSSLREIVVRCIVRLPDAEGREGNVVVFRARGSRDSMVRWLGTGQTPTIEQIRAGILAPIWWDRDALLRFLQQGGAERRPTTPEEGQEQPTATP